MKKNTKIFISGMVGGISLKQVYLCSLYVHAIEIRDSLGVEGHCWEDVRVSDDSVEEIMSCCCSLSCNLLIQIFILL